VYYLNLPKRFIGGIIVDIEQDEVLAGARITLENKKTGEISLCNSDCFGDFWFKQIEASEYCLYVEYKGYLTRMIEVSTLEEDKNVGPIVLYKSIAA